MSHESTLAWMDRRLREELAATEVLIHDDSRRHAGHEGAKSGGGHYFVTVVSSRFAGLTPVKRHRLVNGALREGFGPRIHALSITALTPEEHKQTG
ncbi:MAG: hypothetical protein GMKNLPBB_02046 [Myxococcota bacterium]|nr:hypothetical protein [Myxococcota bacterium]